MNLQFQLPYFERMYNTNLIFKNYQHHEVYQKYQYYKDIYLFTDLSYLQMRDSYNHYTFIPNANAEQNISYAAYILLSINSTY